jgi:hypothetical protein
MGRYRCICGVFAISRHCVYAVKWILFFEILELSNLCVGCCRRTFLFDGVTPMLKTHRFHSSPEEGECEDGDSQEDVTGRQRCHLKTRTARFLVLASHILQTAVLLITGLRRGGRSLGGR